MTVQLRDGRTVAIRPVSTLDGGALRQFHEGLSNETTRMRFFVTHPCLTEAEVERFTHVDHHEREALVMTDDCHIVGVARYDRVPGTDDAEVAFVIADGWQGHGAGPHLLGQLVARARDEGISRFAADTLCENHRMRKVFRHSGLIARSTMDGDVIRVVLDLQRESPAVLR
jgi:RimJ/RimL family protein N-acetyltransferase